MNLIKPYQCPTCAGCAWCGNECRAPYFGYERAAMPSIAFIVGYCAAKTPAPQSAAVVTSEKGGRYGM